MEQHSDNSPRRFAHAAGRATRPWLWPAAIVVLGSFLFVSVWGGRHGWFELFSDLDRLRSLTLSLGIWAPVGVIALNVVQVVVSPIPGHALNMVSGYLFGPWLGTLYTLIGMLVGSLAVLLLVRWLGRPFAERLAGKENLARFDRYVDRHGRLFLFWIFLFPFLPDDIACLAAGLTPLPIHQILLLALIGRAPGLFMANLIGYTAADLMPWQWAIFGGVLLVMAALAWYFRDSLESFLMHLARRLSRQDE